jgi:hypothetical protein
MGGMGRKTGAQERHFCEQKEPGGRCGKKIDLTGRCKTLAFPSID